MVKQRGVALIIVLLITALVVIIATEMGSRLQLNVQRIQNIKDSNQAQWYAFSAEAFAEKSIKQIYQQTADKISIDQAWSQEFTFPLDGGGIQAQLIDMQSCFNLNALAAPAPTGGTGSAANNPSNITPQMTAFARLLENIPLSQPIESFTIDTVRDSLADWLDEDDRTRDFGAEDSEYESREFPYVAANNLLASQTELRLINGVSAAWINDLWPYVCVIPNSDVLRINVNTLTPELAPVLASVTGLDLADAQQLISTRPNDGWQDGNDFFGETVFTSNPVPEEQREWFVFTTDYFILHTKTRYNNASFSMSSLFQVISPSSVAVVRREFGGIK